MIKPTIREREEELFARWRLRRPGLVTDGVVDETTYLATSRRILIMLKEVNSAETSWDLRGFLHGGGHANSWDTITCWVEGIRALPTDLAWPAVRQPRATAEQCKARRIDALRSIAVVNLKKSPGTHTANVKQLHEEARADQDLIRQQVHLYRADLIICCGVGELVRELALVEGQPVKGQTRRGVSYYKLGSGYVIDYLHPEARCAGNLLYYGLIDALRELLYNK